MTQATTTAVRTYIGLGSNLVEPVEQIRSALAELDDINASGCIAYSSLYRSAPLGPAGQPDYVNAVAALDTELSAHDLLTALQDIEQRHGRDRSGERWGPRILDLDILLYGRERIDDHRLTIPHPEMHKRNFVLYPLYEIAPRLDLPGLGSLRNLLERSSRQGLQRLEETGESITS